MLRLSELQTLIDEQRTFVEKRAESSIARDLEPHLAEPIQGFARIISGIRRCGKSTLLYRLIMKSKHPEQCLYLNFDTPKLFQFTINEFRLLDEVLKKQPSIRHLFLDEIQLIDGWESFIREKIDQGYFITITGSNAQMLSRELGTRLTGRHLSYQLFPFNYSERLRMLGKTASADSFAEYLLMGGFPAVINQQHPAILSTLVEDILYRDIAVRYGIREIQSLKNLVSWLASNTTQLLTASKLKSIIEVNSVSTVTEYLHYLSECYLIQLMQRFSWKEKNIIRSPRKSYLSDPALIQALSIPTKSNWGHRLELVVHNVLYQNKHPNQRLYYWQKPNEAECDFVLVEGSASSKSMQIKAYQVCYKLTAENESREVEGLYQVMHLFNTQNAQIITYDQADTIHYKGSTIEVVKAWK